MDRAAHRAFTESLAARLAGHPDVLGLVALGSTSGEPPEADAWSDHDFSVVARPRRRALEARDAAQAATPR